MPPEYGSLGDVMTSLGRSSEEEKLLIDMMKKRGNFTVALKQTPIISTNIVLCEFM